MFSFVFVTLTSGVPGRVWCLIVSIPDLDLPIYLVIEKQCCDNRKHFYTKPSIRNAGAFMQVLSLSKPRNALFDYIETYREHLRE